MKRLSSCRLVYLHQVAFERERSQAFQTFQSAAFHEFTENSSYRVGNTITRIRNTALIKQIPRYFIKSLRFVYDVTPSFVPFLFKVYLTLTRLVS